jgi:hypothetical protein
MIDDTKLLRIFYGSCFNPRPRVGDYPRPPTTNRRNSSFNPRPRVGDYIHGTVIARLGEFQSTPARGRLLTNCDNERIVRVFQSTPARGRLHIDLALSNPTPQFQSTPARGRLPCLGAAAVHPPYVSIHARAWATTSGRRLCSE